MTKPYALALLVSLAAPAAAQSPAPSPPLREALERQFVREQVRVPENVVWLRIDPRQAALTALERNFAILGAQLAEPLATAAWQQARALFDAVFVHALTYNRSAGYARTVTDLQFKKQIDCPGGVCTSTLANNPAVFSLTFDQGRVAGYYPSTIIANTAPPTGSDKTVAYNLQVNKLFSKGASAFASDSLVYRDAKFAEDIGHVVVGSYGRSWTNQLTTGIATPLPGSRFFGDYAVADVALRAADIGQQAAFWQVAGVVNATLFQVEQAYWNLVLAKRVYEATTATGDQVRALAMRTERLFQTQETTRYGKAKVDAQLANLARQEDEALNRYLGASNALANLLDLDRRAVLLPADDASLETGATLELGAALEQGTARNPSIRLAEANATIAQLFKDQSRVQLRPDLTGTAVFNFLQDDSTFGYRTPGEALRGTRSPDIESQSYTLAFVRPWDNRGAEANFLQAQARLAQQTLGLEQTRRGVASQIALAVAASQSAQSRVESARRARELAESVFARAGRQRSLGVVGDFEVIVKSIDLLSADLDYQSALIDRRISEAAVYTAIGSLPQRYGERSAP